MYTIAVVLHACAPQENIDTSRLRKLFVNIPTLDRNLARRIRDSADDPSSRRGIGPACVAISNPSIAHHALNIPLDNVPYTFDPTQHLGPIIAAMHISQTADSLSIDGLTALCEAVPAISKLPHATIASLDLRHHYKCLV